MARRPMERVEALLQRYFGNRPKSMPELRERFVRMAEALPKVPDARVEVVHAPERPAHWVRTGETVEEHAVLFLHGGGYNCGSPEVYRDMMARLSSACAAPVLGLDYRLAPEHPHPAALEDALAGYEWLLGQGFAPERIVFAGDSAGGGLVLCMLLALRDQAETLPAGAVCISPWTDLAGTGLTMETKASEDPWLIPDRVPVSTGLYLGEDGDARDPLASPLYGDPKGLPPLLIQVGTREILLDDSLRFAEKARHAGVDVTLELEAGMIHVWPFFAGILPEGQEAIDRIGAFVRERTGAGRDPGMQPRV